VDIAVITIDRMHIDDPVGAVAVHGVNGVWGTLAVGLFAAEGGLLTGGGANQFIVQLTGVAAIAFMSFVITFALMKILDVTMGIRVSREEELAGIDAAEFGVESYAAYE